RDTLRPESLDLPATDGPQLGRANDSVGRHDPEPGKSLGLLDRKPREDEGDLAGCNQQVLPNGSVSGHPAFRDGGHNRQDLLLETYHSACPCHLPPAPALPRG